MYGRSLKPSVVLASLLTLTTLTALTAGCQSSMPSSGGNESVSVKMDAPAAPQVSAAAGGMAGGAMGAGGFGGPPVTGAAETASAAEQKANMVASAGDKVPVASLPRRIIYTGTVDMVCDKFSDAAKKFSEAVKAHGGFIADSNVVGAAGDAKTATWKVRIPVDRFDAFMNSLGGVGEVQSSNITSQDVSEEFYDLGARIKNKRVEEARLIQHLQQSTGKLNEILQVEREISRVREEIERMEGRQRFLAHQSDLTTVTVTLREIRGVAVAREETPSLWTQITRTFGGSLAALGDFMKAIVLFLVGALPWFVVLGGILYPFWYVRKKRTEMAKKNAARMYGPPPGGDS